MPLITVFTPTYNRAHTLHLCYESLCRQSCKDFIWLIIDDGSTDNTKILINEWQNRNNGFDIRYIYKKNGGMHTAHNTAYENIDTELNVCIDSDDYMTDNAIELIKNCWQKNKSNNLAGIIALDIDKKNKNVIGTKLPVNKKTTTLYSFYENGGKGDKKLIYRTDIIKSVPPYPVFSGEKYIGLGIKYRLVDDNYELFILNEPVCVVEYQPDGSSMNMFRQYLSNPKGFAYLRKFQMTKCTSVKRLFIECVHYVSSSILMKNKNFIVESPKKFITLCAIPAGVFLTLYIKLKSKSFMKIK